MGLLPKTVFKLHFTFMHLTNQTNKHTGHRPVSPVNKISWFKLLNKLELQTSFSYRSSVHVSWEFYVHQSELSALSPVKISWVNSSTLLGHFCPAVRAIISKSCYRIVSDYVTKFKLLIICFPDLCRRCRFLASRGSGSGPRVLHQLNKVVEQVFVNKKAFLNFFLKWSLDVFRSNFPWRLLFLFYSLPTNNTITCTPKANTLSCGYHIFFNCPGFLSTCILDFFFKY